MAKWNKTSDGYPTTEVPVLVSDGKYIFAALAVWIDLDEDSSGWLWEVTDFYHSALNDIGSYEMDDDYQFEYWMTMPDPPAQEKNDG